MHSAPGAQMNLNLLPDLALFVQIVDQGSSPPSPARTALPLQPLAACHGWSERWAANCCSVPPASCVLAMPGKRYISMPSRCWKRRQAMDSAGSRQTVARELTLASRKPSAALIHPLMMAFSTATRRWTSACGWKIALSILSMTVLIWRYASPIPPPGLHGKPLMPIRHVICATEAIYSARYAVHAAGSARA